MDEHTYINTHTYQHTFKLCIIPAVSFQEQLTNRKIANHKKTNKLIDMDEYNNNNKKKNKRLNKNRLYVSPWPMLLSSSAAGMVARATCHPLDTCKAVLQVQSRSTKNNNIVNNKILSSSSSSYQNFSQVVRGLYGAEGIRGFYRGFGIAFFGGAPALCLYLSTYEKSKEYLNTIKIFSNYPAASHFSAGMMAEAVSCILFVPIDICKERLQVQGNTSVKSSIHYNGSIHAVQQIAKTEGIFGLYRAYGATLLSFGPFSAFYFTFYEKFKKHSMGFYNIKEVKDMPFALHMLNSVGAGMGASFVTNPLDLVKLRLQIQRQGGTGKKDSLPWGRPYRNLFDGLKQMVKHEGFLSLFKGVGARMGFHGPATAISMACYETFNSKLKPYF